MKWATGIPTTGSKGTWIIFPSFLHTPEAFERYVHFLPPQTLWTFGMNLSPSSLCQCKNTKSIVLVRKPFSLERVREGESRGTLIFLGLILNEAWGRWTLRNLDLFLNGHHCCLHRKSFEVGSWKRDIWYSQKFPKLCNAFRQSPKKSIYLKGILATAQLTTSFSHQEENP